LSNSIELDFSLHDAQAIIHSSDARFKVVAAGRRFGKSYLACITLLLEGLKDECVGESGRRYDLGIKEVWYVAPTFEKSKGIMWPLLKMLGHKVIATTHENTATCTLVNGRRIAIKGSDRPDTLRGRGLSYVVLDEFAFMKEDVWEKIIRPALSDVEGRALFIGTPEGKNHFYNLFMKAGQLGLPTWQAFQFKSIDNPTMTATEIMAAKESMSTENFRQEYEASFTEGGGKVFKEEWWQLVDEAPGSGDYVIAIDLAGFIQEGIGKKGVLKVRDEHAIAVVYTGTWGWYIEDIIHGHWDVRRTALEIVSAYRDYRPIAIGIEQGMAKNAVTPYLEDEMKRLQVYFTPYELTHGNKHKPDRIKWSLQGRAEKGRIFLKKDATWVRQFIEQANDFPSPLSHDDLIDAVAYADQLASTVYINDDPSITDSWVALDDIAGF
jgi:predicted phage terminase large subunit-like protein